MGGLLRAPKPTAAAVAQPAPTVAAAAPVETLPAAAQAATVAREEARGRAKRGLAGTIATTDRGVLGMVAALPVGSRKTLLGQ